MKKIIRLTSFLMAVIIAIFVCFAPVSMTEVWASGSSTFFTVDTALVYDNESQGFISVTHSVNDYYIWVEYDVDKYNLRCGKDMNNSEILKSVSANGYSISQKILTNGSKIFFLVYDHDKGMGAIYKTGTESKKCVLVAELPYAVQLEGYYDKRIYYTKTVPATDGVDSNCTNSLYKYNVETEKNSKVLDDFVGCHGYGKYITGRASYRQSNDTVDMYLYNCKTDKKTVPVNGFDCLPASDGLYYASGYYYEDGTFYISIYSCGYDGGDTYSIVYEEPFELLVLGQDIVLLKDSVSGDFAYVNYSDGIFKPF
ncbi:MAG: hypothetical protein Q4C42_05550 [Clostridia bacterium]|nr:hypothetical protein [Clostridia bacterium]